MKDIELFIDAKALAGFKRRCIYKYYQDREHLEGVFLEKDGNTVYIKQFVKIKIEKADSSSVYPEDKSFENAKKLAISKGYMFATIHTHINFASSTCPSTQDYESAIACKEYCIGILDIYLPPKKKRLKTKLNFWFPQTPLKLHIVG